MSNIKDGLRWGSPVKEKGWDGLNNAAINSFNSNVINSFVREIFQNSNDARREDKASGKKLPLKISISYKSILKSDLLYLDQFVEIFQKISDSKPNKQHKQFFKNGFDELNKESLKLFVYEDYNTTGLSGSDNDPECTFNSCILSEGTSVKENDTAGGSYGIGKNSIYGFSKVRTVFYSSFNEDTNEYIFQGLGKLASYNSDDKIHDSRVYFGVGNQLSSVRDKDNMPDSLQSIFKRKESGLSQFALCPIENENWVEEFVKAILRNYWPLLHNGELYVELKEEEKTKAIVSKEYLNDLMLKYFDPKTYELGDTAQEGNPYDFYTCFINDPPQKHPVTFLGNTIFHYKELDHKFTNRIAYLRNGMVIQTKPVWGFGSIGYCGIFLCESLEGNILLRMMEPHTHDRFDPSRLNDKSDKYNSKDGEKVLKEIDKIIRNSLNEILNKYRKKAEDIPWLSNLIRSLKGFKGKGTGNRTGEKSDKETLDRISSEKKHDLIFSSASTNQITSYNEGPLDGLGGGGMDTKPQIAKPLGPTKPPGPGRKKTKKVSFTSRVFRLQKNDDGSIVYKMILNSLVKLENSSLMISQVGDSGNAACFEILDIKDSEGRDKVFSKVHNKQGDLVSYQINGISIPSILKLIVKEPYKSSFRVQEF